MLFVYPAIFHKEEDAYWVEFKSIASPSDISAFHTDDGFSSLVSCDINQYKDTKAVKKTLTIPSWLNDRAMSMGLNFSQVLQEALLLKIQS